MVRPSLNQSWYPIWCHIDVGIFNIEKVKTQVLVNRHHLVGVFKVGIFLPGILQNKLLL